MKLQVLFASALVTLAGGLVAPLPVVAQVAPTAAEAGRYTGLHAAAQRGDAAAIRQLEAAGASLNAREAYGRTPLHVATFARQRNAVRALLAAGADPSLLESDRYDAVTIAAS